MKKHVTCPVCDFPRAIPKANDKGSIAVSCPDCGSQTFARSAKAVTAMQKKLADEQEAGGDGEKKGGQTFAEFIGG